MKKPHEDEEVTYSQGASHYYAKRDGKFVEVPRDEFVAVVSGITVHGASTRRRKG